MGIFELFTDVFNFKTSWILLVTTLTFAIVYQCLVKYWTYFSKNDVKFYRGLPFLGSQYKLFLGKLSMGESLDEVYKMFPNERFYGVYDILGAPAYVIRDLELVKAVTIKDFDHFINHRMHIDVNNDPLLGRSLFVMADGKWREMRSTLSPTFTGNKMRLMLSLINDCAKDFCEQLQATLTDPAENIQNFKDLSARYACDTIASTAFGLKINSLVDKENEFLKRGLEIGGFNSAQWMKLFGYISVPNIMSFLKIRFFSEEQSQFFRQLVNGNMKYREENNVVRNDMINLLMEARKGQLNNDAAADGKYDNIGFATVQEPDVEKKVLKTKWEDDDFVAQSMLFFLAGFSAVSIGQCFMAHELTVNSDIQQRLYEEIVATNDELNGRTLTYEALQKMKYLDMVVSETLRRWTLSVSFERKANKPYTMENSDGNKIQLKVGDAIYVPVHSIHMDPENFPNPEKFDPERFSDANKHNIRSGSYMPFGSGPRNCIASRFALMEMKSLFYYLVLNFSLEKCEKTQHPIVLKKGTMMSEASGGYYYSLKPRRK